MDHVLDSGHGAFEVHNGVVETYDADAGLGTVSGASGLRWQFHCTVIADGTRSIEPGTSVRFRVGPGGPGRFEAFDVAAIDSEAGMGEVTQKG